MTEEQKKEQKKDTQVQYQMQELEELPKDLKFICNNENGKFVVFGSRNPERLFAIFRHDTERCFGSILAFKELIISSHPYY